MGRLSRVRCVPEPLASTWPSDSSTGGPGLRWRDLPWAILLAWAAFWLLALVSRAPWAINETRYLSVAWEMWQRGEWLVPYLNGAPYSHKPPLLFWLIQLGWWAAGDNDWWPRLLPWLFSAGTVLVTADLAKRLWPGQPDIAARVATVLVGTLLWAQASTAVMFDMLVAFLAVLAVWASVRALMSGWARGWLVVGLAVGLGMLAKGPVIFLYTLPAMLLAPWWGGSRVSRRWVGGLLGAVVLAVAIALAWAVPAAKVGGDEYAHAIFWSQTAERLTDSFAHARPWWWYMALLPGLLVPWSILPAVWRRLRAPAVWWDGGARLCVTWAGAGLLALSLISGKQVHYMIPLLPPAAMIVARMLGGTAFGAKDVLPAAVLLAAAAVVVLAAPYLTPVLGPPPWLSQVPAWPGIGAFAAAAVIARRSPEDLAAGTAVLASSSLLALALGHAGIVRPASPYYDPTPTARYVRALQDRGVPVAFAGKYHGELHFPGRLSERMDVVRGATAQKAWRRHHANGRLVVTAEPSDPLTFGTVEARQPFRGKVLLVVGPS
jgi:4-amino-4-deoxy-L-arabinose transferase-like glycosyltransferase